MFAKEYRSINNFRLSRLSHNSKSKEKERQIVLQIQKEGKFLPSKAIVRQPLR
jgi:hypothetical protein